MEQTELKGVIYIGKTSIEMAVAKVGDGWMDPLMESTHLMPELEKMNSVSGNFDQYHEALISILAEIRDQIFSKYQMIPVQLFAGGSVRNYERRNELNWLIEEATGYRMTVLSESEDGKFSIHNALMGQVFDEMGFESLVDKIKKASETDAFHEK